MGKWDGLSLPKLPPEHKEGGSEYQVRVNLKKDEIRKETGGGAPAAVAARYREARKGRGRQLEDLATELGAAFKSFAQDTNPDDNVLRAATDFLDKIGKEELEALLKRKNLEVEACTQLFHDGCEAEGLTLLRMSDGASLGCGKDPYAVVIPLVWSAKTDENGALPQAGGPCRDCREYHGREVEEDLGESHPGCCGACGCAAVPGKHVLRQWMLNNGHAELLESLVPTWQTLNKIVKERMEEGMEPPPGIKAFMKSTLTLRGAS